MSGPAGDVEGADVVGGEEVGGVCRTRTVAARIESGDGKVAGGEAPVLPPNTHPSTLPAVGATFMAPDWL